jgi:hypothetical protein
MPAGTARRFTGCCGAWAYWGSRVPDWLYYPLALFLGVGAVVLFVILMQGWRH